MSSQSDGRSVAPPNHTTQATAAAAAAAAAAVVGTTAAELGCAPAFGPVATDSFYSAAILTVVAAPSRQDV